MPSNKRNKKRNFFGAWRKCHGDPAKIVERIGATMEDYKEWMKDPAFVERFEEAACNEELVPEDVEGWLLLAKEIPFFKWYIQSTRLLNALRRYQRKNARRFVSESATQLLENKLNPK